MLLYPGATSCHTCWVWGIIHLLHDWCGIVSPLFENLFLFIQFLIVFYSKTHCVSDGSPEQIFFMTLFAFRWSQKPANWGSWAKSSSPSTFINEALKGHSHSYVFIYYLGLLFSITAESWQRLRGLMYWLFHDYDKHLKEVAEARKHILQLMVSRDAVHYSGECIGAASSMVWKAWASLLTLGRSGNRHDLGTHLAFSPLLL